MISSEAVQHWRRGGVPEAGVRVCLSFPNLDFVRLAGAINFRGFLGALRRRLVLRLGHTQTIGAIVHQLCRVDWIFLHRGVRCTERSPRAVLTMTCTTTPPHPAPSRNGVSCRVSVPN